jgi:plastocyanin
LTAPGAAGIRCRLDGGVTLPCDGGALHVSGLGGVGHVLEAWDVDTGGGQVTAATRWRWSVDLPNDVIVSNTAFTPSTRYVSPGATQLFSFAGPGMHTVTDASGMGLFDSGQQALGALYGFTIPGAGSYAYRCTILTSMTGTVKAGMTASPPSGKTSTVFTLSWAAGAPPSGYGFDVQVKRPGSSTWVSLRNDTLTSSTTWTPPNGTGTYQFRARLQRLGTTTASGWSAALSVSVTA